MKLARVCSAILVTALLLGTGASSQSKKPTQVGDEVSCYEKARALAETVKDQQKLIEVLEKEVGALKKELATCTSALAECKKGKP